MRIVTRLGALLLLVALVGTVAALSCASTSPVVPADLQIPLGTYGGDSGGMIVGDTAMHLHIACTFGDVSGRVPVDASGRFDVTGSYMLGASPLGQRRLDRLEKGHFKGPKIDAEIVAGMDLLLGGSDGAMRPDVRLVVKPPVGPKMTSFTLAPG